MKTEEKIKFLQEIGGTLVGSRAIGQNNAASDFDVAFTKKEDFDLAVEIIKRMGNIEDLLKEEIYQVQLEVQYRPTVTRTRLKKVGELKIDLLLVERVLKPEEQLLLHLEKYPEKIQDTDLPHGWEPWVYKKKLARMLSEQQKPQFILWLADNGKI